MLKQSKVNVIEESVRSTVKDARAIKYYLKLTELSTVNFNARFPLEWTSNIKDLLCPSKKEIIKEEELTGIFRKTPGASKSSSGVTFGFGGVDENGE